MEPKKNLEKKAYKISDITSKLGLTARAIRYYESEGLLGRVTRSIGFTRYYTKTDITRLREIKHLKNKGYKIKQIKQLFEEKYSQKKPTAYNFLTINDTLIEKKELHDIINLDINISYTELAFNNYSLKYIDWEDLKEDALNDPFTLKYKLREPKKTEIELICKHNNRWVGNSNRGLVNLILKNHKKGLTTPKDLISKTLNSAIEWLIIPTKLNSSYRYIDKNQCVYILEQRKNEYHSKEIHSYNNLIFELNKQIKDVLMPINGLINQVTIHSNPRDKISKKCVEKIKKLFPHKELVSIDKLSPLYIESIGCNNAILLSII